MVYKVVEKFISVNGEGKLSGQLAVFIRFAGCNLNCSYCDTKWANEKDVEYELMTSEEIYSYIKETGVKNVTITGGEPLIQDNIIELLTLLTNDNKLCIEIETNGSINLKPFVELNRDLLSFTMDYKLASSKMEDKMIFENFMYLSRNDIVKFVVNNIDDLTKTKEILKDYNLLDKTSVYISPVFGQIELTDIVNFMKENKMNNVNLQLQLHKIIWGSETKGV